ncbi:AAA family ATPase [Streptomyces sp. DT2A-34]|uniref:AAA family ATPase n=1 Tax=Streptomyces sp. DT2A-34 TaxID=3051182 RepID=UPI00265B877E|nr:AAA family ATPase [Streptomyces sp. DT2A-34]MDO0914617.1 AAA family ATPase [Streptomyces sp. DT2A-34]
MASVAPFNPKRPVVTADDDNLSDTDIDSSTTHPPAAAPPSETASVRDLLDQYKDSARVVKALQRGDFYDADLDALWRLVPPHVGDQLSRAADALGTPLDAVERGLEDRRLRDEIERRHQAERRLAAESDETTDADEQALAAMAADTYTSDRLDELPQPEWLIDGVLPRGKLIRTNGPPKSLKSFVTLDMAASVGTGCDWHGHKVAPARVLYVVAEGASGTRQRVRAWEELRGCNMTDVDFYPRPVQLGDDPQLRLLRLYVQRGGYGLVVFDTQARCTVGVKENDAAEMGVIIDRLGLIQERTGASCWLVHHTPVGDDERGRGSSAVLGAVDTEFAVNRNRQAGTVTIKNTAQKDAEEMAPATFDVVESGTSIALTTSGGAGSAPVPEVTNNQLAYLRALADFEEVGATATELREEMGMAYKDRNKVSKVLGALAKKGLVRRTGSRHAISELGRRAIQRHRLDEYVQDDQKEPYEQQQLLNGEGDSS